MVTVTKELNYIGSIFNLINISYNIKTTLFVHTMDLKTYSWMILWNIIGGSGVVVNGKGGTGVYNTGISK